VNKRGKSPIEKLAVVYMKVDDLIPYARNSRTHSDDQVAQIAASIREFGFTNPVLLDGDRGIIAGHGRVLAARKLGHAEVPCIELKHLTDAQRRAYVIADNKLAMNAGWDFDMLSVEIDELRDLDFDLPLLGFTAQEINEMAGTPNFFPASGDEQSRLDVKAPTVCPECGH
jgi:ParB family transcriptional regulator, chromosome partitioning protein